MAAHEWPWSQLPHQAAVIDRLREVVAEPDEWRWLEVCCSLDGAGRAVVEQCGIVTDALAHVMPGWPPETRRLAVEFDTGVQLDLVLMPSTRRSGLPTGAIAVVDKDRRLTRPWQPPAEDAPSPALAREWLMLGWWALSDVAKYRRETSPLMT
jgi:hypothetical protein